MNPIAKFGRSAIGYFVGKHYPGAPEDHLLAAEAWLCRAQDASADGGVSYGYSLLAGWRPSYPETSGYIATTFFRLARERDPSYAVRARRILRWLLSVQNADGSFSNPRYGKRGIVFDAGQVLFGLVKGFELTGSRELLVGARRAAAWLTQVVDADLRWKRAFEQSTCVQYAHGMGPPSGAHRLANEEGPHRRRTIDATDWPSAGGTRCPHVCNMLTRPS